MQKLTQILKRKRCKLDNENINDSLKPLQENVMPQEVTKPDGVVEANSGGRPSIENDLELQEQYLRIFKERTIGNKTIPELMVIENISKDKAYDAIAWVEKNYLKLLPEESYARYKYILAERKRKLEEHIEALEVGDPILDNKGIPLLDLSGKPYLMKDRELIRLFLKDLFELDKAEMQMDSVIKGTVNLSQTYNQATNVVVNNVDQIVNEAQKFSPEDKEILIQLMKKYGRPPK